MRVSGLLFVAALSSLPALLRAQETPPDTAARAGEPALRIRLRRDSLFLERPAPLLPFGRLSPLRLPAEFVAESRGIVLQRSVAMLIAAEWGQTTSSAFAGIPSSGATPVEAREIAAEPAAPLPPRPEKTDIFGQYADLGLQMHTRIEAKAERNKNDRCAPIDLLTPVSNCAGSLQPQFDFQFNVRTGGVVADRIHVNVDYDSEREFDASNNISVYYEGKQDEMLHRLEVGNVSFAPAPSRFITAGIPSGNYGLQAVGQLGPMSFRTIMAQQKGNVVKDRVFTVGDRTLQTIDREIEDFQLERRRFFWVIDARRAFPDRFPNVDILDRGIEALAARIPTGERPRRVLLYRYRPPTASGSVARDINGPYAHTRFARNANEIGPFEVLQEGIDYFVDPSGLWIALVNPIQRGERLAVSFTVTGADGREAIVGAVGGTFPTERGPSGRDTVNLLWDNDVLPGDAVFDREIRSVYRLGGDDIQRNTVSLKVVVGSGNDQEKPAGSTLETFLQMFGLAQPSNTSAFDIENRLWPRLGDPNLARNAGAGDAKLIRDYFVVFPSLRPFADSGLAEPPNPLNDSLYRTPDEDLSSSRRPPTQYRIRARYSAEGGGDAGSLTLGSVQVRQNSERLLIDGIPLTRDTDYRVDYELGRVTFTRPDTLFARPRRVTVQYEENPLFAVAPTSIFGLAAEVPMEKGQLSFTAISQRQKTTFNRPPLGFEPASALVAGVSGVFNFESEMLTRALDKLPFLQSSRTSRIGIQGEFATSRPQPNAAGVAYIETFEGEGGIQLNLSENLWRTGSRPFAPGGVLLGDRSYAFAFDSAATIAWQNVGLVAGSRAGVLVPNYWFAAQIDSQFRFTGGQAFRAPELLLWNTLYPSDIGGLLRERDGETTYLWRTRAAPGRRWRSITQSFGSSGVDLTRVEHIELWTLIDTRAENLARNPALVIDFGDLSENTVAFRPETLTVSAPGSGTADSSFTGRTLAGYDRLDTERDLDTRSFDAARNDRGLPGDRAETLVKKEAGSAQVEALSDVPLCDGGVAIAILGDTRNNCTVANRRLDEEDLDLDGVLNMLGTENANERLLRYVVDLSDQRVFDRVGLCYRSPQDTTTTGGAGRPFCWVRVRVPFTSPRETIGDPLVRRIRTVRLTIVSGASSPDTFATIPIARMKLVGAPWLKRSERPLAGIAGALTAGSGFVLASVIGTQDRNAAAGLNYEPPPGISDQADDKSGDYAAGLIQINEKSLRLLSGGLSLYERAEAVYRFPEGEKNFMGYERLHVWARGRNKGWGPEGDLQFYIKIGRDVDNFYLYRAPANAGNAREAWNPEQVVDFRKFYSLRTRIQNSFLRGGDSLSCSGLDSALVSASEPPVSSSGKRFVACDSGYIAYTSNPGVSPPNLAAVQEISVGMVRVATTGNGTGGPITPADTLELWVDDIRLRGVVKDAGYAGQLALALVAADVGTVNVKVSRRDSHFRQLAEQPTYATDNQLDIGSSFQLERFLPQRLGVAMPFTVNHASSGTDPVFLSRSDISGELLEGLRKPRTAATSFSLGLRRATPMVGGWYAPILNNVSLNSTYSSARQRSEYQTGAAKSFTGSLDYNLAAGARSASLPRWLDRAIMHLPTFLRESDAVRSLRGAALRWTPSQLRFSSAYAHNTDRRSTFSRPVEFEGDTARQVTGLRSDWRNRGLVELRPFQSLTARWDLNSVRDLRDYGDASDVAIVAGFERERFLGRDVGLERERQMQSVISFAPPFSSWIRPRLDLGTSYSMFRDPNSRNLVRAGAAPDGELRLPRRLVNSQSLSAGASLDVGQAITRYAGDSGIARRIANAFQPINVSWTRDLRSIYDGTPFTPPLGYQFALGGIGDFRSLEGVLATSAGLSRTLSADHGLSLPLGLNVVNRYSRSTSDSWTRRSVTSQALLTASTVTFPDVNVRWNIQPAFLKRILTSIGGQAGTAVSRSYIFQPIPGDATGGTQSGVRTEQEIRRVPLNVSIAWGSGGGGAAGLATTGSWMRTDRKELRSGGRTEGEQNDVSGELSRAFKLPANFNLQGNVFRGRLGFQRTSNDVFFLTDTARKRITDNSRWTINASADTEVAQNATFSLQLARTVNTDDVHDRRFTQTVLSAVLQLQFYSGELK